MKKLIQIVKSSVPSLFACAACAMMANAQISTAAEFVGSTPADALPREFLGGLAANAPCHYIKWELTLSTNQSTGLPATYKLNAQYHVPVPSNRNQSEEGPKVKAEGTWEIVKDGKWGTAVYRINSEKTQRSLSFVQVGDNLIHILDQDRNLMIGNGGWSYTLNRAGHAEKVVPPSVARTVPDLSYPISTLATGSVVFAVFEGRSPCHGIARELNLPQHAGCHKVKWRVTLYQHPETSAPSTYKVEGTFYRQRAREGTWSIGRGTKTDPVATVYRLGTSGTEPPILLLKADDNILFFMDHDRKPMVGNADFSYTLNRVAKK